MRRLARRLLALCSALSLLLCVAVCVLWVRSYSGGELAVGSVFQAGYGLLPCAALARWLRQGRRAASGCCTACGYDLRGTPDRRPECGTRGGMFIE